MDDSNKDLEATEVTRGAVDGFASALQNWKVL